MRQLETRMPKIIENTSQIHSSCQRLLPRPSHGSFREYKALKICNDRAPGRFYT